MPCDLHDTTHAGQPSNLKQKNVQSEYIYVYTYQQMYIRSTHLYELSNPEPQK